MVFTRFYLKHYLFLICGFDKVACSSFAKPGKHFLIETDDAPEKGGADDYQNWGPGGNGRPTGDYQWKPQGPGGGRPTGK